MLDGTSWVDTFEVNPKNTHAGKNYLPKVLLWPSHIYMAHVCAHAYTQISK